MTIAPKKLNVPIQKLIPSIITILALCLGITSIRYSLDGKFNIAVALIIIAAFLDGLDGKIARLLNSTSEFGAQLDSLADLCNFGVAPGIAVYLWSLKEIPYKGVGWAIVLVYIACSALRLARFNVLQNVDDDKDNEIKNNFFVGMPMPVAAGLLLIPMTCSFELFNNKVFIFSYWFVAIYMTIIGLLMISKIPIYSAKKITVPKERVNIILIFLGIVFTGIIFEPWIALPIIGLLYICFIPIGSCYYYCKIKKGKNSNIATNALIVFIMFGTLFLSNSKISNASEFNSSDVLHCLSAIKLFERKYNIPRNFLYLISLVESGKYDKNSKRLQPWPWTANINGKSKFYRTKSELVQALKIHIASGKENIDIGCNQINYKYHKHNFANIEQMASPHHNVGYSAYYLASNYRKTNNWQDAVALYHSKNPRHSSKYIRKINQTAKSSSNLLMALNDSKKRSIPNKKIFEQQILNKKSKAEIMVYNNSNEPYISSNGVIKIPKELG